MLRIINLVLHEQGFTLQGLPNMKSPLELGEFLGGSRSCSVKNDVLRVRTGENTSEAENMIVAGQICQLYLEVLCAARFFTEVSGSSVKCSCENIPAGLGEPCFDKFQSVLCREVLKIPNTIGFEIGSGFAGCSMKGSQHNDRYTMENGVISPITNFAGGVLGGITSGAVVYFTVHFENISIASELLVKSIASLVILDFFLIQKIRPSS